MLISEFMPDKCNVNKILFKQYVTLKHKIIITLAIFTIVDNNNSNWNTILSIALISLMMEAVNISETSVNIYESTRRSIPEDKSSSKET
jgi:hypothetical protein